MLCILEKLGSGPKLCHLSLDIFGSNKEFLGIIRAMEIREFGREHKGIGGNDGRWVLGQVGFQ